MQGLLNLPADDARTRSRLGRALLRQAELRVAKLNFRHAHPKQDLAAAATKDD